MYLKGMKGATRMRTTVEVYKRRTGWGFRVKAGNGEIIATSETYTRRQGAERGAKRAYPKATIKTT